MRIEILKEYQWETIRAIRANSNEMRQYLDEEIANTYSHYCELFHGAGWTEVDIEKFIKWALTPPINQWRVTSLRVLSVCQSGKVRREN